MSINMDDLKKVNVDTLTAKEKQKCYEAFVAFDKNVSGYIEKDELRAVLEEMGQKPSEEELIKMINEVDLSGRGAISKEDFLKIIAYHKMILQTSDEEDIKLAFIALGGNEDKTGSVDRQKLINVIQNEFNLSIDLNRLIKELSPNQNELKYEDFRNLLQN
ncbi:unnamed protein product [Paramecium octaurelia]|uniref:EF-hand domain-containing protein n=3 Tax=Paramecium TaxID=5884 RepID=A0A8S1VL02_PAROT|nr:unnamed protein product [Paramecium octaurelia]